MAANATDWFRWRWCYPAVVTRRVARARSKERRRSAFRRGTNASYFAVGSLNIIMLIAALETALYVDGLRGSLVKL